MYICIYIYIGHMQAVATLSDITDQVDIVDIFMRSDRSLVYAVGLGWGLGLGVGVRCRV